MTTPTKPIVFITRMPPLHLLERLSVETLCPRCDNYWRQRKSQRKRICPSCRAREKEMGKR